MWCCVVCSWRRVEWEFVLKMGGNWAAQPAAWCMKWHPLGTPLLTFPRCHHLLPCLADKHRFVGNVHNKHRQVGNAVPPPLAAALGRQLRKALEATAEAARQKALAA